MPKYRDRTCIICGTTEHTATPTDICAKCCQAAKNTKKRGEERTLLESLGYTSIKEAPPSTQGKQQWSFIHPECGTEQTWTFSNLLKRTKADTVNAPCSRCGGSRRAAKALEGFMSKHPR